MASFQHLLTFRGFYTHGSLYSQLITMQDYIIWCDGTFKTFKKVDNIYSSAERSGQQQNYAKYF